MTDPKTALSSVVLGRDEYAVLFQLLWRWGAGLSQAVASGLDGRGVLEPSPELEAALDRLIKVLDKGPVMTTGMASPGNFAEAISRLGYHLATEWDEVARRVDAEPEAGTGDGIQRNVLLASLKGAHRAAALAWLSGGSLQGELSKRVESLLGEHGDEPAQTVTAGDPWPALAVALRAHRRGEVSTEEVERLAIETVIRDWIIDDAFDEEGEPAGQEWVAAGPVRIRDVGEKLPALAALVAAVPGITPADAMDRAAAALVAEVRRTGDKPVFAAGDFPFVRRAVEVMRAGIDAGKPVNVTRARIYWEP